MSTFFSGTDKYTLAKEGHIYNHFVSLIVNNNGDYTAAITRRLTTHTAIDTHVVKEVTTSYRTWDDVLLSSDPKQTLEDKHDEKEDTVIEWYNLNIHKEDVIPFNSEIDSRIQEIRDSKKQIQAHTKPITALPAKTTVSPAISYDRLSNGAENELSSGCDQKIKEQANSALSKILRGTIFEEVPIEGLNFDELNENMYSIITSLWKNDDKLFDSLNLLVDAVINLPQYTESKEALLSVMRERLDTLPNYEYVDLIKDVLDGTTV